MMNRYLKISALIPCLLIIPAYACEDATTETTPKPQLKTEPSTMIVGGYQNTNITPEIKKMAKFAVKTQSKQTKTRLQLVSIDSAASQVVAGTNFKLILTIKDHQKTNQAEAIVYRDLNGHKQLSSWNWLIK
ncbi:hypothetical protein FK216_13025 [Moraxellaceae bacterium AER2_44_116]|nr:hypothetical protein [Moraxellaceae bacterium]TQC95988.1 hypothetical protein FK216_13025 [Moraxellaceae bacterium AER2_44_116]